MPKENTHNHTCSEELIPDLELGWKEFSKNGKSRENCPHKIIELASPALKDELKTRIYDLAEFTVLAIKPSMMNQEQVSDETQNAIKIILKSEATRQSWFFSEGGHSIFFCIIPGNDSSVAAEHSQRLISIIYDATGNHSNVGIAMFPFTDYSRENVFENSVKAYLHALFYGEDSHAEFDSTSLNISGDLYYQAGEIKNAISEYKKGLEINPDNTNIMNSLGVCLAFEKDYSSALMEFEKAAVMNPSEYLATYNSGVACVFTGDIDKARSLFIKAAETDDSDIKIVFQAGKAALEKGATVSAVKFLEKAVILNPEKSEPYRYLGEAYCKTGRNDKAIEAFKKAVKLNPCDAHSFSALGELFAETGENIDIALVFCNQSIVLSPSNGLMYFRAGKTLLKKSQHDMALESFRKAQELGYDSSEEIEALEKEPMEKAS